MRGESKTIFLKNTQIKVFAILFKEHLFFREEITFRGVPWPTINAANQADEPLPYMLLNQTGHGQVIPEPFTDRLRFWESIGIRQYS